jgi:hypothetical protein
LSFLSDESFSEQLPKAPNISAKVCTCAIAALTGELTIGSALILHGHILAEHQRYHSLGLALNEHLMATQ